MKKKCMYFLIILGLLMLFPIRASAAEATQTMSNNIGDNNYYGNWSQTVKSYLIENGENMTRVEYVNNAIVVENYDSNGSLQDASTIEMELPIFGGVYAGSEYNFIVFGQTNAEEDDSAEVFRIVKYKKDWTRVGAASLCGANTTVPFDAGSLRMTEIGDYLVIRTCHEMYTSSDGLNHQANVTIEVNTESMEITNHFTKVANSRYGYTSHSFNQFILNDNGSIRAVDHGDAYSRAIVLSLCTVGLKNGVLSATSSYAKELDVFTFPDTTTRHYNFTGAQIGGFEYSDNAYLIAASSIAHDDNYDSNTTQNIVILSVNKSTSKVTENWITEYAEGEATAKCPQLVKVSANRFLLMWMQNGLLNYTFLNGNGEQEKDEIYTANGALSDCQPILMDGDVVWYVTDGVNLYFYSMDMDTNKISVINKEDLVLFTYSISNETVEITGCNNVLIPDTQVVEIPETIEGYPVTSIGSYAFQNCTYMKEIVIPDSVTKIGSYAFSGCSNLKTIEISKNVSTLATNAFRSCSSLEEIQVDEENEICSSEDGVLFNKEKTQLLVFPGGKSGSYTVPEGTTSIASDAFYGNTSITSVRFPASLVEIGSNSFAYCTKLKDIVIPETVKTINANAFYNSGYYNDATNWEDGMLYLSNWLIDGKSTLSGECSVKEGTKRIANQALSYLSKITKLTLPESLEYIGTYAFYYAEALDEINLPKNVSEIKSYAFAGTAYYVDTDNWTDNVLYLDNWIIKANQSLSGEYTIAEDTTGIAEAAFSNCYSLTKVTFPTSIKYINARAFAYSYYIKSINTLPCDVKIGENAFYGCRYINVEEYINHIFDNGKVTTEPTCTENGEKTYTCTRCDAAKTEELEATGHTEVEDAAVEATCTKTGLTKGSHCSVCKSVLVEQSVIEAKGHSWSDWETKAEATCTEEGEQTRKCEVCDEEESQTIEALGHKEKLQNAKEAGCTEEGYSGDIICTECEETLETGKTIPAKGHSWSEGEIRKEATCIEKGECFYSCEKCYTYKIEIILQTDHKWEDDYTVDQEATCTEAGSKSIHCSVCDTIKENSAEEIPVTEHDYGEWTTTAEPTYTSEGSKARVCEDCGHEQTQSIEKYILESLDINAESKEAEVGNTFTLSLTCTPVAPAAGDITWSSSDENVVKVDANGKVKVVGEGTATITATIADFSVTCKITAVEKLPFIDVAESDWFYPYVGYVYREGIMTGTSDTLFNPSGTLTRAEVAIILYRLNGTPAVTYKNVFSDVPAGTWYTDAVIWASDAGVVLGKGDGTFAPTEKITREQMALMLYRYVKEMGGDVSQTKELDQYPDHAKVDSWALTETKWAVATGLITGTNKGYLDPLGNTDRAQCATIITRFMNMQNAN